MSTGGSDLEGKSETAAGTALSDAARSGKLADSLKSSASLDDIAFADPNSGAPSKWGPITPLDTLFSS
jgi:hypothetical protein